MPAHQPYLLDDPWKMTLGRLMAVVCRLSGDRIRVKMEKIGLHRGQGFVLMHLWDHDGLAQGEIASAKHVRPATMTNMLKRMERDGWIERRRDSEDERVVRVYLTEKAIALHDDTRATFVELDEEIAAALTQPERNTLRNLLIKVHAQLIDACSQHSPEASRSPRRHVPPDSRGDGE